MTLNNGFARFGDLVYDEETRRFHAFLENGATRRDFDLPMLGTGVLTAEGGRNFAMVEAPDGRIFVGAQFGEFNWRIRGTQIIFPESFSMNRLESDVLVHGAGSYHFWSKNWALEDGPDFVSEKIVQSGGGFVAITPGGEIYHSTDLHDWERVLSVTGGTFSALVLNDGVFVAAGRDESENASIGKGFIYTSVDGREWTRSFSSDTYQVRDVASGRGRFLAVAHDATNAISLVSSNGMVWHPGSVLPDTSFDHVDFGDGIFVAAGFSGRPRVYGSHDGLHWVELQCSIDEPITEVAFAGSVFNLLGPWNTIVRSSPVRDLLTVLLTNLAGKKSVSLGVELIGTSAEIQVSPNLRDWTTWSTPANYLGKALLSEAPTNLARFFRVAY